MTDSMRDLRQRYHKEDYDRLRAQAHIVVDTGSVVAVYHESNPEAATHSQALVALAEILTDISGFEAIFGPEDRYP
jgi:hypothetical protein